MTILKGIERTNTFMLKDREIGICNISSTRITILSHIVSLITRQAILMKELGDVTKVPAGVNFCELIADTAAYFIPTEQS